MQLMTMPVDWAGLASEYERYLLAAGCTPKTVKLRRGWIKRFARWIDCAPFEIAQTAVIEWSAAQEWSQSTRRSATQSVKGFYTWALSLGYCDAMPKVPRVRKSPAAPHPASSAAIAACLQSQDYRVRLATRLAVEIGLRRAEVACINVDTDLIDTTDGTALIVHGKGNKPRIFPLTASLAGELRQHVGYVFPGLDSGHISAAWLGTLVSRAMPKGVTMHSLRHTFTTRAYQATRDLVALQKVLGHASPETTLVYLQIADASLRRVIEAAA